MEAASRRREGRASVRAFAAPTRAIMANSTAARLFTPEVCQRRDETQGGFQWVTGRLSGPRHPPGFVQLFRRSSFQIPRPWVAA